MSAGLIFLAGIGAGIGLIVATFIVLSILAARADRATMEANYKDQPEYHR